MKLKQISVPIENAPDRMYRFTRALGEKGINPKAITLVDKGNFGELRVMVSDTAAARQILMQRAIPARVDDVVVVQMEDKPGQLPDLLERLMEAGVKIKYSYALRKMNPGKATMVFCFNDNDKAIRLLNKEEIRLLDHESFGKLETAC